MPLVSPSVTHQLPIISPVTRSISSLIALDKKLAPVLSPLKALSTPHPPALSRSPVEITLKPLPTKELQERFYQHKSKVQVRRGPAVVDKKRKTGTIDYGREVMLVLLPVCI